jgi:hypothetical protein
MGINIGDEVVVNFNNSQTTLCRRALVKYIPSSYGDSWVFLDLDTGDTHVVSEGCTVTKAGRQGDSESCSDDLLSGHVCNKEFVYENFCALPKGHKGSCDNPPDWKKYYKPNNLLYCDN